MSHFKMKKEIFEESKVWGICWTLRRSVMWNNKIFFWETKGKDQGKESKQKHFQGLESNIISESELCVFWSTEGSLWEALLECPGVSQTHPASLRQESSPLHLVSAQGLLSGPYENTSLPMLPRYLLAELKKWQTLTTQVFLCACPVWTTEEEWAVQLTCGQFSSRCLSGN